MKFVRRRRVCPSEVVSKAYLPALSRTSLSRTSSETEYSDAIGQARQSWSASKRPN